MVALPKGDLMMVQEKIEKNVKIKDKLEVEEVPTAECSLEIEIRPQN